MMGDRKNLPKRDPKQVKLSGRKIVSQSELDKSKTGQKQQATTQTSTSQGSGGSSVSGLGGLFKGKMLIAVVAIGAILLFTGNSGMISSLLSATSGGSAPQTSDAALTLGEEVRGTIAPAELRPYTVLVYMNGTDLESKYGCATGDLKEMVAAGFDPDNINLLILTGGTQKWKNNIISDSTSIYHLEGDSFKKLSDLGNASIADPDVLKSFIDFSVENFPANRFGFVFWNHGGGTIHGYGSDQNYKGASLSVAQIADAFEKSAMSKNKFEFVGFDCCLMGTLEIGYLLQPFANYLIASEEVEPGYGWDYNWLTSLSANPSQNGDSIGRVITDLFVEFYKKSGDQATLSVVDLSEMDNLTKEFEAFMAAANTEVQKGGFNTISKARKGTKAFGYTGQDKSSFDIVDIKHLAQNLSAQFPDRSAGLISAVEKSVVYYKNSDNVQNAYGIATYIPYAAKEMAPPSVEKYSKIGVMPSFVSFLQSYTQQLTGKRVERSDVTRAIPKLDNSEISIKLDPSKLDEINDISLVIWKQLEEGSDYFIKLGIETGVEIAADGTIKTAFDGYWATLGGQTACFYQVEKTNNYEKYSTPAILNGEDVNIIVIFDDQNPDGKVMGAIPPSPEGGAMAAKYLQPIKSGDKVTLKYFAQLFLENEADYAKYTEAEKWVTGTEFTAGENLAVKIVPVDDKLYLYGFWVEDTQGNNYYTDFIEISF